MSERKVISKYIPPSHVKLPQSLTSSTSIKKPKKNNQSKVRMMAPMTMRCTSCGTYIYAGTKFNSRKENVPQERYLGIAVFRFYQRCKVCGSEFTFKTDPKNQAYVAELGCLPSYEPWKEAREQNMEQALDEMEQELDEDDDLKTDAIKELEKKAMERKREMEALDRLDELKTLKDEHAKVDIDQVLKRRDEKHAEDERREKKVQEEDEFTDEQKEKMRRLFGARLVNGEFGLNTATSAETKQRVENDSTTTTTTPAAEDVPTSAPKEARESSLSESLADQISRKRKHAKQDEANLLDSLLVSSEQPATKRRRLEQDSDETAEPVADASNAQALGGLFAGYSSD